MEKRRIQYIDIAKGIAMICIVLGHLGNPQINRVVFTFHVPVFFFITGYFINTSLSVKDFIKNKTRTLLCPYIFTCLAIIILATLEYQVFMGSTAAKQAFWEWIYAAIYGAGDSYSQPFYIKAIGALWFLWATFWGSILMRVLLIVQGRAAGTRIIMVLVLFIAGYWSRNLFWFPFSIQAGCCAVLFIYFGYLFRISKEFFKNMSVETKAAGTIFALAVWIDFIRNFRSFWLVHCDIGRGIIDIAGCICGCYIIMLISWYIGKHTHIISRSLSFLGRYSLFMLCIHNTELNIFPWQRVTQKLVEYGMPGYFQLYLIIAGKLIVIITCTIACANCNIIRKIFGLPPTERKIKKYE
ncbi:MAG: acyltransferase [Lachnospiraceae bacterium]|nr:acyltransferase [Lachnospiraceae bacterium]